MALICATQANELFESRKSIIDFATIDDLHDLINTRISMAAAGGRQDYTFRFKNLPPAREVTLSRALIEKEFIVMSCTYQGTTLLTVSW